MNVLAKHYGKLTPEERFRLIQTALDRGDEAEVERVTQAGEHIQLSMADHVPYAHAFHELLFLTYIELLEDAALYQDCDKRFRDELGASIEMANDPETDTAAKEELAADEEAVTYPAWHRAGELAYAAGFQIKAKLAGWALFCRRWNTSPGILWEKMDLPGLDRIKFALAMTKIGFAYPTPADMVRWMNSVRAAGDPEATEASIISAVRFADDLDATFRERVRWWGGQQ